MRETILWNRLKQFYYLAIVSTLVVAVCQFHLDSTVNYRTLFGRMLETLDDFILLLLWQLIQLLKGKG